MRLEFYMIMYPPFRREGVLLLLDPCMPPPPALAHPTGGIYRRHLEQDCKGRGPDPVLNEADE